MGTDCGYVVQFWRCGLLSGPDELCLAGAQQSSGSGNRDLLEIFLMLFTWQTLGTYLSADKTVNKIAHYQADLLPCPIQSFPRLHPGFEASLWIALDGKFQSLFGFCQNRSIIGD